VLASGVLSANGDFSVTLPASARYLLAAKQLGVAPYAPFTMQASTPSGNRALLSNAVVRIVRP
jgi:hypothetical protein